MTKVFKEFSTDAVLKVGDETALLGYDGKTKLDLFTFIKTQGSEAKIVVDSIPYTIPPHTLIALTIIQYFEFVYGNDLTVYQFNREFYCIKDHDHEVSCSGLLFLGNLHVPIISIAKNEQRKLELLHEVLEDELDTKDTIQAEMLRMVLARFIIIATRILKANQGFSEELNDSKVDLLRTFNVLVEMHFREAHNVSFYAEKLFKSPKTLSNSFAKLHTSPLQIIHDRIILEAKRLLIYTDKTAKEIAYDLGFDDASHLSRLFKKHTQLSPSDFKKQLKKAS